jgi:hypothetical protein
LFLFFLFFFFLFFLLVLCSVDPTSIGRSRQPGHGHHVDITSGSFDKERCGLDLVEMRLRGRSYYNPDISSCNSFPLGDLKIT